MPLDHTKRESPLIKVYVTVFPALTPSDQTPLIFLTGGPGTSTAGATAIFEDMEQPTRALFGGSRDLIVLDQRGTNFAEPSLPSPRAGVPLAHRLRPVCWGSLADGALGQPERVVKDVL